MGLIKGLLTLPLAPVRGTVWVAEQVQEEAERQYYDPAVIRRELEEVDRLRTAGESPPVAALCSRANPPGCAGLPKNCPKPMTRMTTLNYRNGCNKRLIA
jgi:hypothetical protein